MEEEIYCHGKLRNETLGVSESVHKSSPAQRAFLCDHQNDTHAAVWWFAASLGLMDFALGMGKPPAAQSGSLFPLTNMLKCLLELFKSTKLDYKLFQMVFQHIFLARTWKYERPSTSENLPCPSTASPLHEELDQCLCLGPPKIPVTPLT